VRNVLKIQFGSRDRGTLLGILAILFWSTSIGFGRHLTEQVGTFRAVASIYLLGGLVTCAVVIVQGMTLRSLARVGVKYLLGCGGLFTAYMVCLYLAIGFSIDREQAITVGLINYLWPALTLILAVPILRKPARGGRLLLGITVACLGIFLSIGSAGHRFSWNLLQQQGAAAVSYWLALAAAVLWALYSNLSRRWGTNSSGEAVPAFLLATGIFMFFLTLGIPEEGHWTKRAILNLTYLALVPTSLAYIFWDIAVRRGNFVLVATFGYLTPLLSTWISVIYLGVSARLRLWIACVFVVSGAVVCNWAFKKDLGAAPGASFEAQGQNSPERDGD
jgi:drug/metabolite transporter (DMT)-like permease